MLKTLTLKGVAAKKFGRVHRFHVADIREMLRAMCSQVPGFKKYMSNAHHSGVRFAFFRDGENIGVEEFELTSTASEFTMMPVIEGAKQGGVLQIVIGAVALVAFHCRGFFCMGWRGWNECSRYRRNDNSINRTWNIYDAGRCGADADTSTQN
jgi:predicted phage tail protein